MKRFFVFLSGSVFAWAILVIGVLSRLTPSEGYPETSNILMFIGGPIFILVAVSWYGKHWIMKIAGFVQIVSIIWIAKWLLVDILQRP
jgi:hypothetical protein